MSNLLRYLQIEHDFEHDFEHKLKKKKRYSEPKFYDANGDLSKRLCFFILFSDLNQGFSHDLNSQLN